MKAIMPGCPRCGKILSTKQALDYHLSKQKRCHPTRICIYCGTHCKTDRDLKLHQSTCCASFLHLLGLLKNESFDDLVLLDSKLKVHYSTIDGLHVNDYLSKCIHKNLSHNIPDWIHKKNIPHFTKTSNNVPIHISFTEYSSFYIAFIKKFSHKYKLPGFITPDL